MSQSNGTFLVTYRSPYKSGKDREQYGIAAKNRAELKRAVEQNKPKSYYVHSIIWFYDGPRLIWLRARGRAFDRCWEKGVCKDAFQE